MKLTTLCAGIAGLAGIAAISAGTELAFKPAEATKLSKEFTINLDFALDDLIVSMNGEEMDPAMMGLDLDEAQAQVSMTVNFNDVYVGMSGNKTTELKRTFESGTAEYEAGDGESGNESMDELEGQVIVFKWNEEKGQYDLTDEDGEEVDEDMQMMAEDADLRIFLPKSEVEEGDSWSVKGKDLLGVFVPGVNIDKAMARADEEAAKEGDVPFTPSDFLNFMEELGEIECTYQGTKEVNGRVLQVIALKPMIEKTIDLTDVLTEIIDEASGGAQEFDLSVELILEGEGSGELLWDAEAGHFRSYKLDMDLQTLIDASGSAQGMSGAAEVEATTTVSYSFTAE